MDTFENAFHSRLEGTIVSKDLKGLVGPEKLSGVDIPTETSSFDRAGDKGSHFSRYGPEPVIQ
jgi:hypothetical protein